MPDELERKPASILLPEELVLGRYQILSVLDQGGQSLVYLADDPQLSRRVAVKVLAENLDAKARERFKREIQILASLEHKNIVKIFASGQLKDGRDCLVMEYIEGSSLAAVLERQGKLKEPEFLAIFTQALQALAFLHSRNVIHRDLKPANILVSNSDTPAGTGEAVFEVKLVDFGIARTLNAEGVPSQALTQAAVGTAAYMSPEQCKGEALDLRSDLYSLACVMYEAISGKSPFAGTSDLDIMYKHSMEAIDKLSCNPKIAAVISRGMEKQREKRFANAEEMLAVLPELQELSSPDPSKNAAFVLILLGLLLTISVTVIGFVLKPGVKNLQLARYAKLGMSHPAYLLAEAEKEQNVLKKIALCESIAKMPDSRHLNNLHALQLLMITQRGRGDFAAAVECGKRIVEFLPKVSADAVWLQNERSRTLYNMAFDSLNLRDIKSAHNYIDCSAESADAMPDSDNKVMNLVQAHITKAECYRAAADMSNAEIQCKKCIDLLSHNLSIGDAVTKSFEVRSLLAQLLALEGRKRELKLCLVQLESDANKSKAGKSREDLDFSRLNYLNVLCQIAKCASQHGDNDLALKILSDVEIRISSIELEKNRITIEEQLLCAKCTIFRLMGRTNEARGLALEAFRLIEKDSRENTLEYLHAIAIQLKYLNDEPDLERILKFAVQRYVLPPSGYCQSLYWPNLILAELYMRQGRLLESKSVLEQVIPLIKANKDYDKVLLLGCEKTLKSVEKKLHP